MLAESIGEGATQVWAYGCTPPCYSSPGNGPFAGEARSTATVLGVQRLLEHLKWKKLTNNVSELGRGCNELRE